MKRTASSCCGTSVQEGDPATEIPEQIQLELDMMGGLDAVAGRVPVKADLERRGKIYHALSDPIRLSILYIIRNQPLCVCVINRLLQLSGSKLSYHLNILKESGLIIGEYHGNWIIYSVTDLGQHLLRCTEHAGK